MKSCTIFFKNGYKSLMGFEDPLSAEDVNEKVADGSVSFWVAGDATHEFVFNKAVGTWEKLPTIDVTDLILTQTDSGCFISRLTHHDSGDTSSELIDPEKLTKKQLIELLNKPRKS